MIDSLQGDCEPRFAPVRAAFAENFTSRAEHGAAVAVWMDGRLVVDLWGGARNAGGTRPWQRDTLVCMMSVVKAVTAVLVHVLVERGRIDLDRPVAAYWPEFGANGKDAVLVLHVLDHRAGVPALTRRTPPGAEFDWKAMTDAIAAEPLRWPAGATPGYHPVTMGFIAGEIVRRVTGATPGSFLRELTQDIPGFDYYIGVPSQALARCAELHGDYAGTIFGATDHSTLAGASIAQIRTESFNTDAFRQAEIPSINGHGTPRSVATLFGHLAQCRAGLRASPISQSALARATEEQWRGVEQTSNQRRRMALGLLLAGEDGMPESVGPAAFGHGGAGGALGFADPDHRLGFAYGTAHLHSGKGASPRTKALVDALRTCV